MAVLGWGSGGDGGHWRWEVVSHVGHMVSVFCQGFHRVPGRCPPFCCRSQEDQERPV